MEQFNEELKTLNEYLGISNEQAEEALLTIRDSMNMLTPPNGFATEWEFYLDVMERLGITDSYAVYVGMLLDFERWVTKYMPNQDETVQDPGEPPF